MTQRLVMISLCLLIAGCGSKAPSRGGVMSEDLPITVADIAEIRDGEKKHIEVLQEYKPYESPKLHAYLEAIADTIAEVSDRPHLPYRVVLLDDDEVNAFGGPGGYIYITRGMLSFVESERELAGVIAHEVAHIANREYADIPRKVGKMEKAYDLMVKGTEVAKDAIGTYGTAANYALKGMRHVKPRLMRRFTKDEEIEADRRAIQYLMKAGYDPRGIKTLNDRLAKVDLEQVARFINYMHVHPPFPERRVLIDKQLDGVDFESGKIEFKADTLSEVRQAMINPPEAIKEPTEKMTLKAKENTIDKKSFVFKPVLGVHPGSPTQMSEVSGGKDNRMSPARKRWSWF